MLPAIVSANPCVQISWLRHTGVTGSVPDLLTVGNTTYTGDTRIRASFSYPNNWRLEIRDVQRKDSGVYVCQISTHPPMGLHTYLQVKGMNHNNPSENI